MSITLDSVLALKDPAFGFQWKVSALIMPDGLLPLPLIYFHSIALPHTFYEQSGHFVAAKKVYNPGMEDINAFSCTLYEDYEMTTSFWLQAWRDKIKDVKDLYGLDADIKATLVVSKYSSNNMTKAVAKHTITGVFPTTQSPDELSYDNGNRLIINCEFSCDDSRLTKS